MLEYPVLTVGVISVTNSIYPVHKFPCEYNIRTIVFVFNVTSIVHVKCDTNCIMNIKVHT